MMLSFFEQIDTIKQTANRLVSDIENTYRHVDMHYVDAAGKDATRQLVVHSPMNIYSYFCGISAKPHHNNAFDLGSHAFKLMQENFEKELDSTVDSLRNFQSENDEVPQLPLILDTFDVNRRKLIGECELLLARWSAFTNGTNDFDSEISMKDLLSEIAKRIVDTEKFKGTPEMFKRAKESAVNTNVTEQRMNLCYWTKFREHFKKLNLASSHFLMPEKISVLTGLCNQLTPKEIDELAMLVDQKYQEALISQSKAITHSFEHSKQAVVCDVPKQFSQDTTYQYKNKYK